MRHAGGMDIEDVPIRGDMIRLGQLLKYVGVAESGSDAAAMIADGTVSVNGTQELRRGAQLGRGTVVEVLTAQGPTSFRLV